MINRSFLEGSRGNSLLPAVCPIENDENNGAMLLPPTYTQRKKLARTLAKKFTRAMEGCHSYLDFVILEESLESVLGYQRGKRHGLISEEQMEMFNQPREQYDTRD